MIVRFIFLFCLPAMVFAQSPVPQGKPSDYPTWWFTRDVIRRKPASSQKSVTLWPDDYPLADDFAAVNIGQFKNFVYQAASEIEEKLSTQGSGMGDSLAILIYGSSINWGGPIDYNGWMSAQPEPGYTRDDYAAVNQGQLKAVVKLVYDQLNSCGYTGAPISPPSKLYPWSATIGTPDDFAPVNIGQLKRALSFELGSAPDVDHDGLPDSWEQSYLGGITAKPWADDDLDGATNLAEYQADTNPMDWKSGSFGSACSAGVDNRLTGKSLSNSLALFSTKNDTYTVNGVQIGQYVRNVNFWGADLDLTCVSSYNSVNGAGLGATLITPRHILMCAHAPHPAGSKVRFVKADGTPVDIEILEVKVHPNYNGTTKYPDFCVGLLASEIPSGINFATVLPANYGSYIPESLLPRIKLPCLVLNQFKEGTIHDYFLSQVIANVQVGTNIEQMVLHVFDHQEPINSQRNLFYKVLIGGDSGNPIFLICNGKPILTSVNTSPGGGTNIAGFISDINTMILQLDEAAGISHSNPDNSAKYRLTTQDLSAFSQYP